MKVKIALKVYRKSNAELLIYAGFIVSNIASNAIFKAAHITNQALIINTCIINLKNAIIAQISETKIDNIRACRDVLERNLNALASMIEILANDHSLTTDDQRIGLIHDAGMAVRGRGSRPKQAFSVGPGPTSGTAKLKAATGVSAHMWGYAEELDNFSNKVISDSTVAANTIIKNLIPYKLYAFFHKAVKPGVATDWEGPLFFTIDSRKGS
ncbi:hypothetical protein WSM22_37130 [Cytophagales bacterium WSM2-2]|nr:hypothetical protein WSM22_37130 [Cytophagales bacterium WSM2-2]